MSVQKLPGGTRGNPRGPGWLAKIMMPIMLRIHPPEGGPFPGAGPAVPHAPSGRSRGRRDGPCDACRRRGRGMVVVASASGAAGHPGWSAQHRSNPLLCSASTSTYCYHGRGRACRRSRNWRGRGLPHDADRDRNRGSPLPRQLEQEGSRVQEELRPWGVTAKRRRWRWIAQVLLAVTGALSALSASVTLGGFSMLDRAELGLLTEDEAVAWGSLAENVGLVVIVLTLATAVPFLTWLHRTVGNVPFLGGGVPRWSPTASVVWWFIPIAFAFMPYLVMRELKGRLQLPGASILIPVAIWWAAWIGAEFVARIASRGGSDHDRPDPSHAHLVSIRGCAAGGCCRLGDPGLCAAFSPPPAVEPNS